MKVGPSPGGPGHLGSPGPPGTPKLLGSSWPPGTPRDPWRDAGDPLEPLRTLKISLGPRKDFTRWYDKRILRKGYSVPRDILWIENYKLYTTCIDYFVIYWFLGPRTYEEPGPLGGPKTLRGPRTLEWPRTLRGPKTLGGYRTLGRPRALREPRTLGGLRTLGGPKTLEGYRTLRRPRTLGRFRYLWGPRTLWVLRIIWWPRKDPGTYKLAKVSWFPNQVFNLVEFTNKGSFNYHCWMQINLTFFVKLQTCWK